MGVRTSAFTYQNDALIVRHRNPLAGEFVIVSQVVLVGYPQVSDGAKLTFWVIYGHDWHERGRGGRKGYAYPTVGRLSQLRHTTSRTIQRHLQELITVGLLSRELHPGKRSVLYIEEPTEQAVEEYLQMRESGGDNNVRGVVTKMSPHKKENTKQENSVNVDKRMVMEEGRARNRDWKPVGKFLELRTAHYQPTNRVGWLAEQILVLTKDRHSLGCYRAIAGRCPEHLVFEALAILKEARQDGIVRTSPGAFFVATVRRLCHERGLPELFGKPLPGVQSTCSMLTPQIAPGSGSRRVLPQLPEEPRASPPVGEGAEVAKRDEMVERMPARPHRNLVQTQNSPNYTDNPG